MAADQHFTSDSLDGDLGNRNPDIFSDDYAESLAGSYAESSAARSTHAPSRTPSPELSTVRPQTRTSRSSYAIPWSLRHSVLGRGTSVRKASNTGRQDEDTDGGRGMSSIDHGYGVHRSMSTASAHSFAGSQSPFSDPTGPSHPYGMYPQDLGISRTTSVATVSTLRTSRMASTRQPAHPYALYPQNTNSEAESSSFSPVPVGFPGNNSRYNRRIGADGEEQDLVGVDGHIEQLPAYSRYADEHTKQMGVALPSIGEASVSPGIANTFYSPSALQYPVASPDSPIQSEEVSTPTSTTRQAHTTIQSIDMSQSEKSWREKDWKERRATRFCGLPLIWIGVTLAVMFAVFAFVCAGVLGGILGKKHGPWPPRPPYPVQNGAASNGAIATVTTTQLIDAAAVTGTAMPNNLPPAPTGRYKLNISDPIFLSNNCLSDSSQLAAWSCEIPESSVCIDVDNQIGNPPTARIFGANGTAFSYGVQPPNIPHITLTPVRDQGSPDLGIAMQLQTTYDKLVVLSSDKLNISPNANRARSMPGPVMPLWQRKAVSPSDNPWFCYFNDTFLEAFIFVQNNTAATQMSINATAAAAASVTSTSTSLYSSSAAPSTIQIGSSKSTSTPIKARDNGSPNGIYPKIVKLEERRLQSPPGSAFCKQMQYVQASGGFEPLMVNNQAVQIILNETDPIDPTWVYLQKQKLTPPGAFESPPIIGRAANAVSGCYCQWNNE